MKPSPEATMAWWMMCAVGGWRIFAGFTDEEVTEHWDNMEAEKRTLPRMAVKALKDSMERP